MEDLNKDIACIFEVIDEITKCITNCRTLLENY